MTKCGIEKKKKKNLQRVIGTKWEKREKMKKKRKERENRKEKEKN